MHLSHRRRNHPMTAVSSYKPTEKPIIVGVRPAASNSPSHPLLGFCATDPQITNRSLSAAAANHVASLLLSAECFTPKGTCYDTTNKSCYDTTNKLWEEVINIKMYKSLALSYLTLLFCTDLKCTATQGKTIFQCGTAKYPGSAAHAAIIPEPVMAAPKDTLIHMLKKRLIDLFSDVSSKLDDLISFDVENTSLDDNLKNKALAIIFLPDIESLFPIRTEMPSKELLQDALIELRDKVFQIVQGGPDGPEQISAALVENKEDLKKIKGCVEQVLQETANLDNALFAHLNQDHLLENLFFRLSLNLTDDLPYVFNNIFDTSIETIMREQLLKLCNAHTLPLEDRADLLWENIMKSVLDVQYSLLTYQTFFESADSIQQSLSLSYAAALEELRIQDQNGKLNKVERPEFLLRLLADSVFDIVLYSKLEFDLQQSFNNTNKGRQIGIFEVKIRNFRAKNIEPFLSSLSYIYAKLKREAGIRQNINLFAIIEGFTQAAWNNETLRKSILKECFPGHDNPQNLQKSFQNNLQLLYDTLQIIHQRANLQSSITAEAISTAAAPEKQLQKLTERLLINYDPLLLTFTFIKDILSEFFNWTAQDYTSATYPSFKDLLKNSTATASHLQNYGIPLQQWDENWILEIPFPENCPEEWAKRWQCLSRPFETKGKSIDELFIMAQGLCQDVDQAEENDQTKHAKIFFKNLKVKLDLCKFCYDYLTSRLNDKHSPLLRMKKYGMELQKNITFNHCYGKTPFLTQFISWLIPTVNIFNSTPNTIKNDQLFLAIECARELIRFISILTDGRNFYNTIQIDPRYSQRLQEILDKIEAKDAESNLTSVTPVEELKGLITQFSLYLETTKKIDEFSGSGAKQLRNVAESELSLPEGIPNGTAKWAYLQKQLIHSIPLQTLSYFVVTNILKHRVSQFESGCQRRFENHGSRLVELRTDSVGKIRFPPPLSAADQEEIKNQFLAFNTKAGFNPANLQITVLGTFK